MQENNLQYLLVNSTNEFLVEYNTLEENSRYKLTGFSGSAGEALVTPETIYLFVDGRYHIQADLEVDRNIVTVVKLQTGQKYLDELINKIPNDAVLGIFSKKNSQDKIEKLAQKRNLKLLDTDPFDNKYNLKRTDNIILDTKLTGKSTKEKISIITKNLEENEAIYVTDLDEVSYLFNMRNFSQNFSAKIKAKAIISKSEAIFFTQDKAEELTDYLKNTTYNIYTDKTSINAFEYNLLGTKAKELTHNPVKMMKAQKTPEELAHLKDAFRRTDIAVNAIRDFINNNENISEYDIATQLEKEFYNQGAKGLSFNSIVARNQNSALAHYSKSSKDEIVKNGDLVLIDCGAYFEGGLATDITRVFVKGEPHKKHKFIYTYVLKAFLHAFNYCKTHKKEKITGYEIDEYVREFFNSKDLDGFVFNHGLGHGIGINVHEYPPSLSSGEFAKVPLLDGECFSIEPGLYKNGEFGVRLENSCYYENGQIHSFVRMNYEKKLIDYDMLNDEEKEWLKEFEVK
ncbi:M24 family metallopeptidase [bacterium]|nr:M24 family metallopeptidase [bacterium]